MLSRTKALVGAWVVICLSVVPSLRTADPADVVAILAKARLVQEIDCAAANKDLLFIEYPAGASKVQTVLDTPFRTLSNKEGDAKFFAYRIGEGKGLVGGKPYILTVEYPEDVSRTMYICNWGCETTLGFATGQSLGDVLKGRYVPNNPESLKYPLSGKVETWTQLFYLHDRFPEIKRPRGLYARPLVPEDGFWVVVAQAAPWQDPLGAGAAVSKIRLYEVTDSESLQLPLRLPPKGLPRRHVFSREEMADNAVGTGHKPEEQVEELRGVKTIADWFEYKMRAMQFLGINTFSKDLLEFGHNQGWDSSDGGGNDWVYQSSTPQLWDEILERAAKLKLTVLPYYEYRGSVGGNKEMALGSQHRCRRLDGGETYTHIAWCEGNNADITDPDTIADAKKMLDVSLLKYQDKAAIVGAWFRQRPTAMPVSFNEANFRMFAAEANEGNRITRSHLQADQALLDRYYAWWFGKRRAFFDALADHLQHKIGPEAFVIYTNDSSEPGRALPRSITGEGKPDGWQWMQVVATDEFSTWETILANAERYPWFKPYAIDEIIDRDMHLRGLVTFAENWDKWDNANSTPPDDPQNYRDAAGVMLSYTYNRLYTVGSPRPFDAYRSKAGLALVRHYSLNEHEMNVGNDEPLGYFIADVERAGPYCMMAEARAVAYGDPTHLGSLTGNSNHRGFPQYVRNFHANFLALPALPSTVVPDAASDPEVFVRQIRTQGHGTYIAVINTGLMSKQNVRITLPASGKVIDAATGAPVAAEGGAIVLSLYPGQLRSLHLP